MKTSNNSHKTKQYKRQFARPFPTLTECIFETIKDTDGHSIARGFLSSKVSSYRYMRLSILSPTHPALETREEVLQKLQNRLRQDFYAQLSYLRRNGFVEHEKTESKNIWRITKIGKEKWEKLKKKINLPIHKNYKLENDKKHTIVIFDIPEKEKQKREWIRNQLVFIGFTMLQKSVWIGKGKIPQEFFEDIAAIKLNQYLHIFRVTSDNRGTLPEWLVK